MTDRGALVGGICRIVRGREPRRDDRRPVVDVLDITAAEASQHAWQRTAHTADVAAARALNANESHADAERFAMPADGAALRTFKVVAAKTGSPGLVMAAPGASTPCWLCRMQKI